MHLLTAILVTGAFVTTSWSRRCGAGMRGVSMNGVRLGWYLSAATTTVRAVTRLDWDRIRMVYLVGHQYRTSRDLQVAFVSAVHGVAISAWSPR